eukprot:TRINITY_DN3655_c0_g1_i5.p1 TRINITY_DN3655_c0_g1~~TRINITY_DN3655_c0_g1_i5.p1  ORF type:complete len:171 (+),score=31.88 TRINITY_DN3655_c0_g1_i5:199-711(+)
MEDYDPTLEDSYRKQVEVDGLACVLDIIDTAGQDDFIAIRESYYVEGEGFLCVFDVTSQSTFADVPTFHNAIRRVKGTDKIPFLLVGNKCDLVSKRKVTKEQAEDLATKLKCKYIEASAKTRKNVDIIFPELVRATMQVKNLKTKTPEPDSKEKSKSSKSKQSSKSCLLI